MDIKHINTFKVVLVGSAGCGKTTFLKRHRTGQFETRYLSTIGCEVHPLSFNTNYGKVILSVWDCAGQEKFQGLKEGYYTKADAGIVMFDLTSSLSYRDVQLTTADLKLSLPNVPLVICGNKSDELERKVRAKDIILHRLIGCKYYDISAKTNYNFEKPFLSLIRKLMGHDDLIFIAEEPVKPVEVPILPITPSFKPAIKYTLPPIHCKCGAILTIASTITIDENEI